MGPFIFEEEFPMKFKELLVPALVSLLLVIRYDLSGFDTVIATFMCFMLSIGFLVVFKLEDILKSLKDKQ